jgi:hypothetical protein
MMALQRLYFDLFDEHARFGSHQRRSDDDLTQLIVHIEIAPAAVKLDT